MVPSHGKVGGCSLLLSFVSMVSRTALSRVRRVRARDPAEQLRATIRLTNHSKLQASVNADCCVMNSLDEAIPGVALVWGTVMAAVPAHLIVAQSRRGRARTAVA